MDLTTNDITMEDTGPMELCFICNQPTPISQLERHVNACLERQSKAQMSKNDTMTMQHLHEKIQTIEQTLVELMDLLDSCPKSIITESTRDITRLAQTLSNRRQALGRFVTLPTLHPSDSFTSPPPLLPSTSSSSSSYESKHPEKRHRSDDDIVTSTPTTPLASTSSTFTIPSRHPSFHTSTSSLSTSSSSFPSFHEHHSIRMNGDEKHAYVTPGQDTMMSDEEMVQKFIREEEEAAEKARAERQAKEDADFKALMEKEGTCIICSQFKGSDDTLCFDDCGHRICTTCLRSHLLGSSNTSKCPADGCNVMIPDWMAKRVLSETELETYLNHRIEGFLSKSQFVKCPNTSCGMTFEPVKGSVENTGDNKDENGNPLSQEALQDRAHHRFRCPTCATIFCGKCKTVPYHLGYTCDSYQMYKQAKHCRFCSKQLTPQNRAKSNFSTPATLLDVCNDKECIEKRDQSCDKKLSCGHACGGIKDEKECLGCLQESCCPPDTPNADEYCAICYVESLGNAPAIRLKCGHVFHLACVKQKLDKKWPGARITFGFLNCPLCKQMMQHPALQSIMEPSLKLREDVKQKAAHRLEFEGLDKEPDIINPTGRYYGKPTEYAMDRFAYYPCYKCKLPFFGGRRQCEEAAQENADGKFKPEELMCGACVSGKDAKNCKKHGKEYLEFKCRFCCNVATFYCWGSTHFCSDCHKKQENGDYVTRKPKSDLPQCPGPRKCPIGIKHPPPGTEYPLGCGICRPREF